MDESKARGRARKLSFEQLEGRRVLSELLFATDFDYQGAFRLPGGTHGGSQFGWGGKGLTFNANDPANPNDDTLFIVGHDHEQMVAEVSIPEAIVSGNPNHLRTASVVQPFADVTDGLKSSQLEGKVKIGGLLVNDGELLWTAYEFYDADADARVSHGVSPLNLSGSGDARGMYRVGALNPGFTAGYMAHIPSEWQDEFGAPVLTGQSTGVLAIISRTSAGPALFGFDPKDLGSSTAPAEPFLYYVRPGDGTQELAGGLSTQNPLYNYNSSIGGVVFPEGSRSVVFFGGHGTGAVCYGTQEECNDPVRGGKGHHDVGGNYVYQAWAYDVLDLLAVKGGQKQPWEIEPYQTWEISLPIENGDARLLGAAYDPLTNRVFVSQYKGDFDNGRNPLIHVFQLDSTPDTTAPAISNVRASSITDNAATISWSTNEQAQSDVIYWPLSDPTAVKVVTSSVLRSTHSLRVTGLAAETAYGYRVRSADGSGNESTSADSTFTTNEPDNSPPQLTNMAAEQVTPSVATVVWSTNEAGNSTVEYWPASSPGSVYQASSTSYVTQHQLNLASLQPGTEYRFRASSSDASGNVGYSAIAEFATPTVPPLLEGAIGFWKSDEIGGDVISDASGNGKSGVLQGGASFVSGHAGNALHLDGANDYVDLGGLDVSGSQLTLSAWVKADLADTQDRRIISKATTSFEQSHYFMLSTFRSEGRNRLRFRLKTGSSQNSGTTVLVADGGEVTQSAWHHVAATYDGARMRLYLDGNEVGRVAKSGAVTMDPTVPVYIGANPGGILPGQAAKFWDGQLDEVGIWERALSAEELRTLIADGVHDGGGAQPPTEIPTQAAYGGTPRQVASGQRIEAEDFDVVGGYHDASDANAGGRYRPAEPVDIEATTDVGAGFNVGWIADSEFLEYAVDVTPGRYDVHLRAAALDGDPGEVRLLIGDGPEGTEFVELGTFDVAVTGGWQNWTTLTLAGIDFTPHQGSNKVLRLEMVGGGFNVNWIEFENSNLPPTVDAGADRQVRLPIDSVTFDAVANDDRGVASYRWTQQLGPADATLNGQSTSLLRVSDLVVGSYQFAVTVTDANGESATDSVILNVLPATVSQTPFAGTAHLIEDGSRIEAEDFDHGPSYFDTSPGNFGGHYRLQEDVDIQATTDGGPGFNVGWIADGEYLEYTVQVESGAYTVHARVAALPTNPGQMRLLIGDGPEGTNFELLGTFDVPSTAGWQNWTTLSLGPIDFSDYAGQSRVLRLEMVGGPFNLNWLEFDQLAIQPEVNAGPDRQLTLPQASTFLDGTVSYGGEIAAAGSFNARWETISGPAGVSFADASAIDTNVSFVAPGTYVLRLQVDDGQYSVSDEVTVVVAATPETITLTPVDDAYLENGVGFNNNHLRVESGQRQRTSFLRFDLSQLSGYSVDRAELRLTVDQDPGAGTVRVFAGASGSWSEDSLNASNAPAVGTLVDEATGGLSVGQVVTFDVTAALAAGSVTFVLALEAGGNDVWFSSREGAAAPRLVIQAQSALAAGKLVAPAQIIDDSSQPFARPPVESNDPSVVEQSLQAPVDGYPATGEEDDRAHVEDVLESWDADDLFEALEMPAAGESGRASR